MGEQRAALGSSKASGRNSSSSSSRSFFERTGPVKLQHETCVLRERREGPQHRVCVRLMNNISIETNESSFDSMSYGNSLFN
jgi:hypothetical protein